MTGERIESASAVNIDPATGERVGATAPSLSAPQPAQAPKVDHLARAAEHVSMAKQAFNALFPTAAIPEPDSQIVRIPKPIPGTMAFDPLNTEARRVPVTDVERTGRALAMGAFDAMGAPTRAAGSAAGQLGYTGATGGGKGFLEGMADSETGLMRPVREAAASLAADGVAGGEDGERGLLDYGKIAAGALGYVAASAAEDPAALMGGLAKAAPAAAGKVAKAITTPLRAPVEAFAEGAAPKVKGWADRVQQTVLKPRAGDWDAGVDLAKVSEYGVQGTVDEVLAKSQKKIDEAAGKLKALIQEGKDGGARVDLNAVLEKARERLGKEADPDLLDQSDAILDRFKRWAQIESGREGGNGAGSVDLLQAHKFKQMMGTHGAWEKTAAKTRQAITQPEKYQSRAAQVVYMTLKDEIEKAAPDGVKDLNKTLSDLIPIRNAATYRKIVSDRNNPISLTDMLGVMTAVGNGPAGAAILAATRFTRSGFGAKSLYNAAAKLERAAAPADALKYSRTLRDLGITSAEIQAANAAGELPNVIPFRLREIAEDRKSKNSRRFSLRDITAQGSL